MVGVVILVKDLYIQSLEMLRMEDVVDSEPEMMLVVGRTRSDSGILPRILQISAHCSVCIRNWSVVHVSANYQRHILVSNSLFDKIPDEI